MKQLLFIALCFTVLNTISCSSDEGQVIENESDSVIESAQDRTLGESSVEVAISENETPIAIEVVKDKISQTSIIQFNGAGYGIEIEEKGICTTIEPSDFEKNLIPKEAAYACRCISGINGKSFYSLEGDQDVLVLVREEELNKPLQNFNWKLLKTWPKEVE